MIRRQGVPTGVFDNDASRREKGFVKYELGKYAGYSCLPIFLLGTDNHTLLISTLLNFLKAIAIRYIGRQGIRQCDTLGEHSICG